jgi:hypothetical protein
MRRPIRPFTVETKKGIRRADKAEGTPTPFLELEPEPVAERRRSTPQMKAAQALFDKPAPASAQPGAPEAGARILRSLIDPPTVLPVCDDFPGEAVRPGRKPGSKNKPREGVLPKNRERPLWPDFMTNGDAGAPEATSASEAVYEPSGILTATPLQLTSLLRKGRLARDQFPRGERWKARLPRFARGASSFKRVQR